MAKDRVQVADLYKDRGYLPQIEPTARPVDTFVSPNKPTRDIRLLELASAFQDIQPGLSRFAQERIDHSNQIDLVAGTKAALENKQQFKQAVDQGLLPAGANPWYKAGYEKQKARLASTDYDRQMREAYAVSGLSDQDDPQKYNQWVAEFTLGWQEMHPETKENPEFDSVFTRAAMQSQDNLASQHAAARTQKIEADVIQNTEKELGDLVWDTEQKGGSRADLAKNLAGIVNLQVANGLNGQVANKLVAQAVVRQAIDEEDITILDMLMDVPSGSGSVGQIGYVKDMVQQARDSISSSVMNGGRISNEAFKAQQEQQTKRLLSSAYTKIADNPTANTREEFDALVLIDPKKADDIESFRTVWLGSLNAQNKVIESGPLKTTMLLDAIKGNLTENQVVQAVSNGDIDYETAKEMLVTHIPKSKEHKSVLNDPIITRFEKSLTDGITKNELSDEFADQRKHRATEAQAAYLKEMIHFKENNPNAGPLDTLKRAKEAYTETLEIYREDSAEPLPNVDLETSDPTRTPLFTDSDALRLAMEEFNKTQGKSGKLKEIASKYQMTPTALFSAQAAIVPRSPPKK